MTKLRLPEIPPSHITPEAIWQDRRQWLRQAGAAAAGLGLAGLLPRAAWAASASDDAGVWKAGRHPDYDLSEALTSERDITTYNNFYEFGTGKGDPARHGGALKTRPWTVRIDGEVARPREFDLDDLLRLAPMEERVYRLRCVEAWSMVIPWVGYSLEHLIKAVEPTSHAKFVEFTTVVQPEAMPSWERASISSA